MDNTFTKNNAQSTMPRHSNHIDGELQSAQIQPHPAEVEVEYHVMASIHQVKGECVAEVNLRIKIVARSMVAQEDQREWTRLHGKTGPIFNK